MYAAHQVLKTISIFVVAWASAMSNTKFPPVKWQDGHVIWEESSQKLRTNPQISKETNW